MSFHVRKAPPTSNGAAAVRSLKQRRTGMTERQADRRRQWLALVCIEGEPA
ncbi:hypothetical protein [Methylorubrum populi]